MKKEDTYKNPATVAQKELESFLQLIADLEEPIELFAMGGTAMVLKGVKESTRDIDFMTSLPQEKMRQLLNLAGLKEEEPSRARNIWRLSGTRIDLFYGGYVINIQLAEGWRVRSELIREIGPIKLYVLGWKDIIFTKLDRNEERDIRDCVDIIRSQKLNIKEIKKEYYAFAETAIAHYKGKFNALEGVL